VTLSERIRKAKRTYIIGNGGSFANAMHIANDLLSCGIRAFTIDPATFSAFANDNGYQRAFEKWIEIVADKEDMLIVLSGSGTSPNILRACEAAERIGMDIHREFGAEQGFDMQASEERQLWLGHEVMRCLRKN
jgi:D-sedoheptulose 7-phosphate isomerase